MIPFFIVIIQQNQELLKRSITRLKEESVAGYSLKHSLQEDDLGPIFTGLDPYDHGSSRSAEQHRGCP